MKSKHKPKIKMNIVDYFPKSEVRKNFYSYGLIRLLCQNYDIIYSDKPDFIICNIFGNDKLDYDCVRIFYSYENIRVDWNLFDYALHTDIMYFEDRYLRICNLIQLIFDDIYWKDFKNPAEYNRKLNKRDKFCSFISSNNGGKVIGYKDGYCLGYSKDLLNAGHLRDRFFTKLNRYKKIDSAGSHLNNCGTIGSSYIDKQKWLQEYKFNLCFENSSYPGYLTEKLFDAYNAGCVPIYWGDTSLRIGAESAKNSMGGGNCTYNPHDLDSIDMRIPQISPHLLEYKINPKAFINAHNFPNLDALVEEVKRIDNDDKAYNAMRNEPLFLDNFDPKTFYEKKVLEFFDNIFSQSPNLAFRRGDGQILDYNRRIRKELAELEKLSISLPKLEQYKLTKESLDIAKFIATIQIKTRKIRRALKFWY